MVPASATATGQGVDELGGHRAGQPAGRGGWRAGRQAGGAALAGGLAEVRRARARRQAVTPLPVSTPSPSGNALGACVQGGMTQLLVAGIQPAAGNTEPGRHPGGAPGSAAAWPGEGRRGRDGSSSFLRRGRVGQRLLEWRSRRRASARSTERGCTCTPKASGDRTGQLRRPQRGVGGQLLLGPGEDLPGELVAAARPGPGRHQPVQPGLAPARRRPA